MAPTHLQSEANRAITVLGAGPAGLAAAYFARKAGLNPLVFEAADSAGGNCRTIRHKEFLFDTGAHRFHDRIPEITAEIRGLLGDHLLRADIPSQIVHGGRYIDFPLSPLNLIRELGPSECFAAAMDFMKERFTGGHSDGSFESAVVHKYGRRIATAFLLGYSEKLWGVPARGLSPAVSGQRLKGLNVKTLVIEAFQGRKNKTEHLDGAFFYPRQGIGMIPDALARACGPDSIRLASRITRVFHNGSEISGFEINGSRRITTETIISTLPISLFVSMLEPTPPSEIVELSRKLRFQNLALVVLFLNRERVSDNASLYFPDSDVPFTRLYEPKNRSAEMAPPGKTCIVVEIPCGMQDECWHSDDAALAAMTTHHLHRLGLIRKADVFDHTVQRIAYAYPKLELGFESIAERIISYLSTFSNLHILGRSASFAYTHVHDLLYAGKQTVDKLMKCRISKAEIEGEQAGAISEDDADRTKR